MSCWIRGCTTKRGKQESSKKESLFTARTEKMFKNWYDSGIAARGMNKFSQKSRICELHFLKDDVLREDTFHTADGETITVQRKIPKLKEDAVPSIFPDPKISYFRVISINEEKQKELQNEGTSQLKSTVNCSVSVPAKCKVDNSISYYEQCGPANKNDKLHTWAEIKRDLESLTFTSKYWCPLITDEVAMWTYWKEDLSSYIWRIILEKSMTLRVYIGEREIDSLGGEIKSIEDIQNIFQKLSNVNPCKEVSSETCAKLCVGYVTKDFSVRGMECQRCIPCAKHHKYILKKSKKPTPLQTFSSSSQSLCVRFKNVLRTNLRLRKKIVHLKKEVEYIRRKCAQANTHAVEDNISKLPTRKRKYQKQETVINKENVYEKNIRPRT